jgi:hypothetical protein
MPPFGLSWKSIQDEITQEAAEGSVGRFGAGIPRVNADDSQLLFAG